MKKHTLSKVSSCPVLNNYHEKEFLGIRAVSSQENVSKIIPEVKYKAELETFRKLTMLERLEKAAPYNLFHNVLEVAPETYKEPNAIKFIDLLCPSLGKLKCSLQICYYADIKWLIGQYQLRGLSGKPLTVLFANFQIEDIHIRYPNVRCKSIELPYIGGNHNSKVGVYVYEDESVRVSVGTVNPFLVDWAVLNQGLWLSPRCPKLPDSRHDVQGESETGFKANLLQYLKSYKEDCLNSYIDFVKRADFSAIRVFFVYGIPGTHNPRRKASYLQQVSYILTRHCIIPKENATSWQVVAQSSSIGFIGKKPSEPRTYFTENLYNCLVRYRDDLKPADRNVTVNIVYPTINNVLDSFVYSSRYLSYQKRFYLDQKWTMRHMNQWKAEVYGRTKVMPRTSIYCRVSPCWNKLAYFLLTSAHLSRSSWGNPSYHNESVYTKSYEAGIMFIPKFFGEEYFQVKDTEDGHHEKLFPLMFDLPLTHYESADQPWYTTSRGDIWSSKQ